MIYTIGGSFWEFGGPDLDRAKLFVMIGTPRITTRTRSRSRSRSSSATAAASSRSIPSAPVFGDADEWVPDSSGTDGALLLALIHEILALGLFDREFLARFTNAGHS
jgi:anaerobic selenocysteine-containing dehydrogenase